MSGVILVVDRRDTRIQLETAALRLETTDTPVQRLPLGPLELVAIHSVAMVGSNVWRALAERNIPAVVLPDRGRGGPAYLGAGLNASANLRIAQHQAFQDTDVTTYRPQI